jgi:hypothetical protein
MWLSLYIPDYSTLSKLSINLELNGLAQTLTPGSHITIDSTGLNIYEKDEWHHNAWLVVSFILSLGKFRKKNRRWDRCARIKRLECLSHTKCSD